MPLLARLASAARTAARLALKVFQVVAVLVSVATCSQLDAAEERTVSAWYVDAVLERYICRDMSAGATPTVLMQNSRPALPLPALAAG